MGSTSEEDMNNEICDVQRAYITTNEIWGMVEEMVCLQDSLAFRAKVIYYYKLATALLL